MGKELPILFNADMVRAILDDVKSCTRRAIKGEIPNDARWGYTMFTPKGYISCRGTYKGEPAEKFFKLPCEKGDVLYVRETVWQMTAHSLEVDGETRGYFLPNFRYAATDTKPEVGWNYSWVKRPSIHMPKIAARIFLKVTDVRVERLRDITGEQAEKEGAQYYCPKCKQYNICGGNGIGKSCFKKLWNSTVDKKQLEQYGWYANPWVWVIEFEQCENPEKKQGGE